MDKILDTKTGKLEEILQKTSSSILITQTKLSEKGINCTNWYNINDKVFKDRFKIQD